MAKYGQNKRSRERQQVEANKKKDARRAERREARKNRPDDFDPFTIVERELPPME